VPESGHPNPWAAYGAGLWSLIFAAFHVIWAAGWYVGLNQGQASIAFRKPLFLAYDLVVAGLCVVGALVALALVQPWGRRVPRLLLIGCLWAGTGLLVLRGGASVIQSAYLLSVGRFSFAAMGIWEPWFYLGATLFSLTAWRYGRRRRQAA